MSTTQSVKALTRNSPTTAVYIDTFRESKHPEPGKRGWQPLEFTASSLSTASIKVPYNSL